MAVGRKTGGRQKGAPNKQTREVKEAIELCFQELGGVPALKAWAETNPDLFYGSVWPKLLPIQHRVGGDPDNKAPIVYQWLKDE
jgi:hypothetical protein